MKLFLVEIVLILLLYADISTGGPISSNVARHDALNAKLCSSNRYARAAINENQLWPNATVNYYYAKEMFTDLEQKTFKKAMKYVSENTCVKFVNNKDAKTKFKFKKISDDCLASYGAGPNQEIVLNSWCLSMVDMVVRHLMHILGFLPTLARTDRDEYVNIDSSKLKGLAPHFQYIADKPNTGFNLLTPYEYGSVLHWKDLSKVLFTTKDELYQNSVATFKATFMDMKMINLAYCKNACKASTLKCKNGGYPNPNDCNVCLCPEGFGEELCSSRPPGFGQTLEAASNWKSISPTIPALLSENNSTFNTVNYWIVAPEGIKIEFQITELSDNICDKGCTACGIEVKMQEPDIAGFRVCCSNFLNRTFVTSKESRVVLHIYTRSLKIKFRLKYRIASNTTPVIEPPLEPHVEFEPETAQVPAIGKPVESPFVKKQPVDHQVTAINEIRLWSNATVNYYFAKEMFTDLEQKIFKNAMSYVSENTCVKFVNNKDAKTKFKFKKISDDCFASYGAGSDQEIVLNSWCLSMVDMVIRHLMHILGFLPTLARQDRDDYVNLDSSKLKGLAPHFQYIADKPKTGIDLLTPYEYGSVLHWKDLSKVLFTTKDELYQNSVATFKATFMDMKMINLAYCKNACKASTLKCKNGGYPNPNDCNVCLCPEGFGDELCSSRPPGFGQTLEASSNWKSISPTIPALLSENNSTFNIVNYWIVAPEGFQIEFQITELSDNICDKGCTACGIEIKMLEPDIAGFRVCCSNFLNRKFVTSEGHRVVLHIYTRSLRIKFGLSYRLAKNTTPVIEPPLEPHVEFEPEDPLVPAIGEPVESPFVKKTARRSSRLVSYTPGIEQPVDPNVQNQPGQHQGPIIEQPLKPQVTLRCEDDTWIMGKENNVPLCFKTLLFARAPTAYYKGRSMCESSLGAFAAPFRGENDRLAIKEAISRTNHKKNPSKRFGFYIGIRNFAASHKATEDFRLDHDNSPIKFTSWTKTNPLKHSYGAHGWEQCVVVLVNDNHNFDDGLCSGNKQYKGIVCAKDPIEEIVKPDPKNLENTQKDSPFLNEPEVYVETPEEVPELLDESRLGDPRIAIEEKPYVPIPSVVIKHGDGVVAEESPDECTDEENVVEPKAQADDPEVCLEDQAVDEPEDVNEKKPEKAPLIVKAAETFVNVQPAKTKELKCDDATWSRSHEDNKHLCFKAILFTRQPVTFEDGKLMCQTQFGAFAAPFRGENDREAIKAAIDRTNYKATDYQWLGFYIGIRNVATSHILTGDFRQDHDASPIKYHTWSDTQPSRGVWGKGGWEQCVTVLVNNNLNWNDAMCGYLNEHIGIVCAKEATRSNNYGIG